MSATLHPHAEDGPQIRDNWRILRRLLDIWDAVNARLGLGTATPEAAVHVLDTATTAPRGLVIEQVNAGINGARLDLRKARGTPSALGAAQAADFLGTISWFGHTGAAYVSSSAIRVDAGENFTATTTGGYIAFFTTANGTTGQVERLRIDGAGNLLIQTAGAGLRIKEGANARMGVATLVAGTVVVNNTTVTANTRIMLTPQDNATLGALRVAARVAGTSFTITSNNAADAGVVAWELKEPA